MSGDLSRWMGAVSDIDNAEKQAKNPPLFKKLFNAQSIEQAAIEAYAAKKKLEEQRYELKMFLNMTYGINAYNEFLAMEGQIMFIPNRLRSGNPSARSTASLDPPSALALHGVKELGVNFGSL